MKMIPLLLSACLLATSCSKSVEKIIERPTTNGNALKIDEKSENNIEDIRTLLNSETPNLALAQFLMKTLSLEDRKLLAELVINLSREEVSEILDKVQRQNEYLRQRYLHNGLNFISDSIPQNYFLTSSPELSASMNFEDMLAVSTIGYLKSQALDEIISTFNTRAASLIKELTREILADLKANDPAAIAELSSYAQMMENEGIKKISNFEPFLQKLDKFYLNSGLNEKEQYIVLMSGLVAGGIYAAFQDDPALAKIRSLVANARELYEKGKELYTLGKALDQHFSDTAKNLEDLKDGLAGSKKHLSDLANRAQAPGESQTNSDAKNINDFIYRKLIIGKDGLPNGQNQSILSKQVEINASIKKTIDAAGNLSNNLNNILSATQNMANLLGVKLPKGISSAMEKAQKVSATVQVAQGVMAGFASGGFLGAVSFLGSGSSLLGVGKSAESAKLTEISKKLDLVLKNQKLMMDMQLETMKMLKELALMVDQYHQKEMMALAELRDYELVSLEISKAFLNKELRACERMIRFQLRSDWKNFSFESESFNSINHLEVIRSKFQASFKRLTDIKRLLKADPQAFSNCQAALYSAFGGTLVDENPVLGIFASNDQANLLAFERAYKSSLAAFIHLASPNSLDEIPLHLPVRNFSRIEEKGRIRYRDVDSNNNYEVERLISAKNLERYLGHLLVLLPLFEVDQEDWNGSHEDIVESYLIMSYDGRIKSHFFLSNALRLIQSGIAQEALLAGEPYLHKLHQQSMDTLFSQEKCESIRVSLNGENPGCQLRENKLLMKNLLSYHLIRRGVDFNFYSKAIITGNSKAISEALGFGTPETAFEQRSLDGKKVYFMSVPGKGSTLKIRLPMAEELRVGEITYSENLPRLLSMQKFVIDALVNVSPLKRNFQGDQLLKLLGTEAL